MKENEEQMAQDNKEWEKGRGSEDGRTHGMSEIERYREIGYRER